MLRKRARSIQKGQQNGQITSDGGSESCIESDLSGQRQKTNSFFNVPGLFIGLSSMGAPDCDSLRSPTSPLDFKLFSNLSCSFRFPKPSLDGHKKCWVCSKVGLGSIVDSLDDDADADDGGGGDDDGDDDDGNPPEKTIPSCSSKTILFGSQIRRKAPNSPTHALFCEAPKSLPKNCPIFRHVKLMRPSNLQKGSSDVLFEIGGDPLGSDPIGKIQSFSLDSKRLGSEICRLRAFNADVKTNSSCLKKGTSAFSSINCSPHIEVKLTSDPVSIDSDNGLTQTLPPSEIELSEDYTCVISHGPNPKTTHIFGDCVLKCHPNGIDSDNKIENSKTGIPCSEIPSLSPSPCLSNDFLSYCHFCKKKLEEGKDIYMYRGEKAFCSWDCRLEEISIEEEKEHSTCESLKEPIESKNNEKSYDKSLFVAI